jgi:anti-sigma factor RsiW
MTIEREHVSFETLNDYVDGILEEPSKSFTAKHIESCSECLAQYRELRDLLDATAQLPRSVLPDPDVWDELRESLNSRKDLVLPIAGTGQPTGVASRATVPRWQSRGFLAAAAVVLVLASSGLTALVLKTANHESQIASDSGSRAPDKATIPSVVLPAVLPAGFRATEGQYSRAIEELVQAVDAQRSHLNPETVRTVDRSLAVIDSAITEARGALIADPGNATLIDLLSATYQRKLDLLRRTSELSSRT